MELPKKREKENEAMSSKILRVKRKWASLLRLVDVDLDPSWDAMIKGTPV